MKTSNGTTKGNKRLVCIPVDEMFPSNLGDFRLSLNLQKGKIISLVSSFKGREYIIFFGEHVGAS